MALTKHQVNELVGYMVALFHKNGWPVPKGLAPYSGTVGVVKRQMIRHVQTTYKLKVTGEFDTATQKFLTPPDPRAKKAAAAMAYCAWAVNHHGSFVYSQERPAARPAASDLYSLPRGGRWRDCSLFVKDAAHVGGFAPLDQYDFASGYGNTDSILAYAKAHNRLRSVDLLRQGDVVIFASPGHAIMITGPHATSPLGARWVASDGHQGAPEIVSLQREIDTHGHYYGIAVD